MVNLENPYPKPRPPMSVFIPLVIFGFMAWICLRHLYFSFIYQYGMAILLGVIIASLFDRELLTAGRIFESRFPYRKIFTVCGITIALFGVLLTVSRLAVHSRVLFDFYRSSSAVSSLEFFLVLVFLVTPFEEIFFRGYLQLNLMHLAGNLPGYIIASLLYGAAFIFSGSWILVLYFLLIGLYLGYLYYKFSSLLLVSLMRALLMGLMVIFPF